MSPRDDALTPEMTRELDALDAALRGDSADAELTAIVAAVRAERDVPAEPFVARLDARAAAGFPRGGGRRATPDGATPSRLRPAWGSRRFLLPALGALATLLLVAVIATSALRGERSSSSESSGAAPTNATPSDSSRTTATTESQPSGAGASPAPSSPERRTRRVERQASLTLGAAADKIDEVAGNVVRVTDRAGAVVLTSNVSSGGGSGGASFELSVPSGRLEPLLAALSRLADVEARNETSADVTGAFVSPRERLTDALTERVALLRQLAKADSPNETASVRARLRTASRQIAVARTELRSLRERTSFSRVSVSVEAKDGPGSGSGAGWGIDDALGDALRILAVTLGVLLVALAVALPLGLVAAALGFPARALRRRRREATLDAV